jgi:energy-coupling factor transporter transmembrane protein EcfT
MGWTNNVSNTLGSAQMGRQVLVNEWVNAFLGTKCMQNTRGGRIRKRKWVYVILSRTEYLFFLMVTVHFFLSPSFWFLILLHIGLKLPIRVANSLCFSDIRSAPKCQHLLDLAVCFPAWTLKHPQMFLKLICVHFQNNLPLRSQFYVNCS